ncbi:MAG: fasciclin domain-containing protein [Acidobacteriota bacterium]
MVGGVVLAGGRKDIVDTAVEAGDFQTLVQAVKAAGLVETLKGDGPFTVFAPTDEAFAKLPAGTLEALLQDKEQLTAVLTYHVVPGRVMAADVIKLDTAPTVNGQTLKVRAGNGVEIEDAKVLKADITTSNGVIHVIDTVLIPS